MFYSKSETITSYFTKIMQIRDQLKAIGDMVDEDELCSTILNYFPNSWESFVQSMSTIPGPCTFNLPYDFFIEEETRLNSRKTRGQPVQEDENLALVAKERKRKGKKQHDRRKPSEGRHSHSNKKFKQDGSKIQCFGCNKLGHYAFECLHTDGKGKHIILML